MDLKIAHGLSFEHVSAILWAVEQERGVTAVMGTGIVKACGKLLPVYNLQEPGM